MSNQHLTIILHIGFWLFLEIVFIWLFSFAFGWSMTVLAVSLNIGLLLGLFYGHTIAVNCWFYWNKIWIFLIFSLTWTGLITYLRILLSSLLLGNYIPQKKLYLFSAYQGLVFFQVVTSLIIAVIGIFYQLLYNRYQRERQQTLLINQQQAAQLQLLKSQMNPHFLFNALNNVYSLMLLKSDDAPKMLLKLSELLRYVLYDAREQTILLEKETINIRKFIDLFQMRSEFPRNIVFETVGDLTLIRVEPMILIPIVENCFKHCDFDTNDDAFTWIQLLATKSALTFKTRNSFDKSDAQKDKMGGVGLKNIRERLALRYPNQHLFEFLVIENVFEVHLNLDFQ